MGRCGRTGVTSVAQMSLLDAALTYASWGWPVLPLVPGGKVPATTHGVHDATTDPAVIRSWWQRQPLCNVGVAAGAASGLVVADIDPRNGGDSSWARWLSDHGAGPDGPIALTAGGGEHHLYQYLPELRSCKLADGVDILSDGRYFVASPSVVGGREYCWEASSDPLEGVAPPPVPSAWLAAYLARERRSPTTTGELIRGNRNAGLTAIAGAMRRHGLGESEILAALRVANETRCEIPLPSSEIARIAASVARYEPAGDVAASAALGTAAAEAILTDRPHDRLQVVFGDELPAAYEAPDELIEGLIVSRSVSVLYGDSNSGKTFFALSLAAAIARGEPVYGRKVDSGLVVYLASEAPGSIRSRLQALKKFYACDLHNLAMVPVPVNFHASDRDTLAVIALVQEIERTKGQPVRLIVGDTLARMTAGANENSGEDMAPVMARFDRVAQEAGAALLLIHHNGKDAAKGARGWSGIRAHIDTEIEVSEKDGVRSAFVTKQRELPGKGEAIFFRLETVEMGVTKFGSPATTCVAVQDTAAVTAVTAVTHGAKSKVEQYRKLFENAWWVSGAELRQGAPYVSRSALLDYLMTKMGLGEASARQYVKPSATGKMISELLTGQMIEAHEHGWLVVDNLMATSMTLKK